MFGRDFQPNDTKRSLAWHIIWAIVVLVFIVLLLKEADQSNIKANKVSVQQDQSTVDEWITAIKSIEQDVHTARTEYDSYVASHTETADNIAVENFIMDKLAQRQTVCQHLIRSYTDMTKTLPSYINYQTVYLKDCSGK